MKTIINKMVLSAAMVAVATLSSGCVERLIKVTSNPPGAVVWLNDQEIGSTPVTVPFTWYGNYSVSLRKDGYQPVLTACRPPVPVYQWPVFDFFSECVLPVNFVDEHEWHYDLEPTSEIDENRLIIRATKMKVESEVKSQATEK